MVVNALIQAIPAICNVLLVCLVFWLIFSIMGVNLFGGRFSACLDESGVLVNATIAYNQSQCLELSHYYNYTWSNPKINFDHVLVAYLALFQVVATLLLCQFIYRNLLYIVFICLSSMLLFIFVYYKPGCQPASLYSYRIC